MRRLVTPVIAVSALCSLFAHSAVAADTPLAATLGPRGEVAEVRVGGVLALQDMSLSIVPPGWQGSYGAQKAPERCEVVKREEGGATVFEGVLRGDGKSARFREKVEARPDVVRVQYEVTPEQDVRVETILVDGYLPEEGNAGKAAWHISDGWTVQEGLFPGKLPDPYVLGGLADAEWAAWTTGQGVGLKFQPTMGPRRCHVQDARQFGIPAIEIQWFAVPAGPLAAGKTVRFALEITTTSAAEVREEADAVKTAQTKALDIPLTSQATLTLRSARPVGAPVSRYGKLELALDLDATYDNPFDPDDIDVTARFISPSGKTFTVPGFFYESYDRELVNGRERLRAAGEPSWRVRFAPDEPGRWRYTIRARDRTGQVSLPEQTITVKESRAKGFVRRSPTTPWYLQFDSGDPYFAVGEDVCWAGNRGTYDYDDWFSHLGAADGNFARIWLVFWNMGLEWSPESPGKRSVGHYYGLGKYSMDNAWRLDHVLETAERNGIYLMLSLGYHGEVQASHDFFGSEAWGVSPYNSTNGGPCASPAEFWTSEAARKLYKQKLRYYVARYGYSPHVQSWEFWNEVNAPAHWIAEMGSYLREHDPYQHLITTTYGNDEVWRLPEIDFTQTHQYGDNGNLHDSAPVIAQACRDHTTRYDKPHLVGEFGIDWRTYDGKYDPDGKGINLHNGLWAAMMSRGLGTAMIWYWDGYVEPKDLYGHFAAIARFARTVPWPRKQFDIAKTRSVVREHAKPEPADLVIPCDAGWGKAATEDFTIHPDGTVEGGALTQFLYSAAKADLRTTPTFHVTYERPGKFTVHVDTVSARGVLRITLDGTVALEKELPTGPGEGEWKESHFMEQWQLYQCRYDEDFAIDVPAGPHVIRLENADGDWISLTRIVLGDYTTNTGLDVRVLGLSDGTSALLWVQNKLSNWYTDLHAEPLGSITGATTAIEGMRDGRYRVEWWDTWAGKPIRTDHADCTDGLLKLALPDFERDVACKIERQ
jgi:hypothetical protein